jgi:integrase/recombinase XerD
MVERVTYDRLVGKAGIESRSGRRPRLHDLRHTFAVRALERQPNRPRSVRGAHGGTRDLHGPRNIYATYWYLEATADLLRDVAVTGEAFMSQGRSA